MLGRHHTSHLTLELVTLAMNPSRSPFFVYNSRNPPPGPVPDRHAKSRHLISKLEKIKEALYVCNEAHSCKEQSGLTVPTRLLDVGEHGTDEIRVVISSEEIELIRRSSAVTPKENASKFAGAKKHVRAIRTRVNKQARFAKLKARLRRFQKWRRNRPADGMEGAYAALSYCWGTCPALKSTRSSLASHKRGLSVAEMPLTLRDAVRVTRDLGLRYLWVDALCILQDCEEDWRRESERMGEVYGHAFVTLFAFGARDCEGGLFSPADQKSPSKLTNSRLRFKDEPLNHRAWALQEWHLSPRRLIFTSYDAIFDCLQGPKREFGHGVYHHRILPSAIPSAWDWELLVINYSSRELTNPGDKLPAISGLAQQFEKISNGRSGRYLAGLWEAYLPSSLVWHRMSVSFNLPQPNRDLARPASYRAPTWSWASINGTVEFVRVLREEQHWDVVAQVISTDFCPAGDNNPSQPMIHRLGLRSKMKSLQKDLWEERESMTPGISSEFCTTLFLRGDGSQSTQDLEDLAGVIWGDCVMRPFKEGPRALKFCAIMRDKVDNWFWGLLLVEVGHASFERIGCGWCLSSWFEDAVDAFAGIT